MKTRRILLPLAVLAAGAVIAFLLVRLRPEVERREAPIQPPLVRVVTARPTDHRLDVASQGTVAPRTESSLVAQVAGRIVEVAPSFAAGGFFRRGETLIVIDPRDYRLALAEARAAKAQAETRLATAEAEAEVARREWRELGRGEPTALAAREPQLAEARAAVAAAEAGVERAELELARTGVEAPYTGRVREKQADVGQYVAPGTPLAAIYATDYAEVRLPVLQNEFGFLEIDLGAPGIDGAGGLTPGAEAAGPLARLTGSIGGAAHVWPARIVRTAGTIDPRTRMLDLFARVDDPFRRDRGGRDGGGTGAPLPMGLFVEATIAGRTAEGVFVLPRAALRDGGRVLVVDGDDRLRFRDVAVLRTEGDRAVISDGLAPGERVCVSPLATVTDGMKVRTVPAEEAAPGDAAVAGLEERP
jgi:RND family efflux transporter MFP subunit